MSRAKMIDHYIDKLSQPGFEFHQIRQELEANNVDEEEIKIIVRIVNNEIQRRDIKKEANKSLSAFIYVGGIITTLGVFITLATYTGIINTGNSFIIAYGPFLFGLSILMTGLARRRG